MDTSRRTRALSQVAVAGVTVAVLLLGGLSVWFALVRQDEARGLGRVGEQVTGQLRAVQALYVVRIETDEIEDDYAAERLVRLRDAHRTLFEGLSLMRQGDSRGTADLARRVEPLARQLDTAVQRFLTDPRGDVWFHEDEGGDDSSEDAMEEVIEEIEALLYDPGTDPAILLRDGVSDAAEAGRTVRSAAIVLVPFGVLSAVICGWMLRSYRRRSEAAMREMLHWTSHEARTDQLTSLPNRRALLEELEQRVQEGRTFTVAMADLNGFKHFNDTFGHPEGDALLRRLGHDLATAAEGHGFAARLGGDEFCLLIEGLSTREIEDLLYEALSEDGEGYAISTVCGLAQVPSEASSPGEVLRLADSRLYSAKKAYHARGRAATAGPATASAAR